MTVWMRTLMVTVLAAIAAAWTTHAESRAWKVVRTIDGQLDTTNFSPKSNFRGSSDHPHLTERFTRVDENTLEYAITADDSTTWTRPWTAMIPLRRTNERMFEYACHEGNVGMAGILRGARAEERAR
jgi:hypothetical protein